MNFLGAFRTGKQVGLTIRSAELAAEALVSRHGSIQCGCLGIRLRQGYGETRQQPYHEMPAPNE